MTTTRRLFCSAALAAAFRPGAAPAQPVFPSRPIRLLVPYAAGGGTDAVARLVAQGMGERLGHTVVVENSGVAGGNLATQQAASAPPDGYTVLMANQGPMVVNQHLFKTLKVDPLSAFDPLVLIAAVPLMVVVRQDSPHATLRDLVDAARERPGEVVYGSPGNGSAGHLATVLLAQTARLDMVHVPYRGAAPALTDLLGGRTSVLVTTLPSVLGQLRAGKARALAVTSKARPRLFPEVPTVAELGWSGFEVTAWYGFVVPRGTPPGIADTLRAATLATVADPAVRARLEGEGGEVIGAGPEAFAAMMRAESARWAEIVARGGITAD